MRSGDRLRPSSVFLVSSRGVVLRPDCFVVFIFGLFYEYLDPMVATLFAVTPLRCTPDTAERLQSCFCNRREACTASR